MAATNEGSRARGAELLAVVEARPANDMAGDLRPK